MCREYKLVELNLDKDTLFDLMMLAHKKDVTLNLMVEMILINYIAESVGKKNAESD